MEKQVYKNDKYVAFKVERGLGALHERLIIRDYAGSNQMDIGISVTAVCATDATGLEGVNILEWLWETALEYLESDNPESGKFIITHEGIKNGKLEVPLETYRIETDQ